MNVDCLSVEVAEGCECRQSSYSQWSQDGEESNLVRRGLDHSFAFHTEKEINPWWEIDLGRIYPLEEIVIFNRRDEQFDRARTLCIEIAERAGEWVLVHSGLSYFGHDENRLPLTKCLHSKHLARYIRLSLKEEEYLHLSEILVYALKQNIEFFKFSKKYNLRHDLLTNNRSPNGYRLSSMNIERHGDIAMAGFIVSYSARLGNLFYQYLNVIQLAQRTQLNIVRLGRHELFDLRRPVTVKGITFVPHDDESNKGVFLSGAFFNSDDFSPVLEPFLTQDTKTERVLTSIAQEFVRPFLLTVGDGSDLKLPDEGTIHFRSGDIFDGDHPITYGYRQPPFAYYRQCVDDLMARKGIKCFRLIYEDRGNPCIEAIETYLQSKNIQYRVQNASLKEDFLAMLDAQHLILGFGTFAYVACRLSTKIETLYYFRPQLGGVFEAIDQIKEVYCLEDMPGNYMKAYVYSEAFDGALGWRNTSENRRRMLEYPAEWLGFERTR